MTTDKLEQIRDALDDLAGFVNERYAGYPETDRRFARDFAVVTRAREALRSLEAAPQPVGAEEGDTPAEILCSRLIDAWCDTNGGQIPWDKAIEITAITTKLPDAERLRLLTMDDDGAPVPADRQVADLSAFVKHLAHQLRKAAPDNDLAGRAVDYLKREGLQGSPMRIAAQPAGEAVPVAWMFSSDVGMLLSADREWCEKTHAVAGTGPIRPLYSAPAPSASPAAHMGAEVVAWQRRVMDGDRPLSGWLHCDEWEVETQREHGNEVRALGLLAAPAPVASTAAVTEDMVSRFLGWRLPDDFAPDCGISFSPVRQYTGELVSWPTGTNLLTAIQARKMLDHVLAAQQESGA